MTTTLSFPDRAGMITVEGQAVSAHFNRLSPTSGRVSWNIPTPAAGCDVDTRAYNGAIVVGSTTPLNLTTSPINGLRYSSDATMDAELHAGDKAGHAFVIASLYNDVESTFIDVEGLVEGQTYYFAVHAVDNVLNYYKAGSHTYSNPSTGVETGAGPGWQAVLFPDAFMLPGHPLPLVDPATVYTVTVEYNCQQYTISFPGSAVTTFDDLVEVINTEIDKIATRAIGSQPPNKNALYLNDGVLKVWDGYAYKTIQALVTSEHDPQNMPDGQYWHDTLNHRLFEREAGAWTQPPFISYTADPTVPGCGAYLRVGSGAQMVIYRWSGTAWVATQTFYQPTSPFVPSIEECSGYWYNEVDGQLSRREGDVWAPVHAIYSDVDPQAIPSGHYWYSPSKKSLEVRVGGEWAAVPNFVSRITTPTPVAGMRWYNPKTQSIKIRNDMNDAWVDGEVIVFNTDPSIISAELLWWDSSSDTLREWDSLNAEWVDVLQFTMSDYDPAAGVFVDEDATWYNSETGEVFSWSGLCDPISILHWDAGDPRDMGDGTIWWNPLTKLFNLRVAGEWVELDPLKFPGGPEPLPLGTYWLNGTDLSQWNGVSWQTLIYMPDPPHPEVGFLWFDTTVGVNHLKRWNGSVWEKSKGFASVVKFHAPGKRCWHCPSNAPVKAWTRSGLYFITEKTGSGESIRLISSNIFSTAGGIRADHQEGADGVGSVPPYMQDGVGSDSSDDARKMLMRDIELALGGGTSGISLELTREDLNHSIDRALRQLRSRAAPYTRGFFPMTMPSTMSKRVHMTNKRLGHDKIVRVIGIYRTSGTPLASMSGAMGGSYPMMYGALAGRPGGDLATYYLEAAFIEEMGIITARNVSFGFNERSRVLEIHNSLQRGEPLLIEAAVEMLDSDIMLDRRYRNWVERWATAESQMKLAEIRGKFANIPGAGGGIVMNGSELRAAATEAFAQLIIEIDMFVVVDPTEFPGALMSIG